MGAAFLRKNDHSEPRSFFVSKRYFIEKRREFPRYSRQTEHIRRKPIMQVNIMTVFVYQNNQYQNSGNAREAAM